MHQIHIFIHLSAHFELKIQNTLATEISEFFQQLPANRGEILKNPKSDYPRIHLWTSSALILRGQISGTRLLTARSTPLSVWDWETKAHDLA